MVVFEEKKNFFCSAVILFQFLVVKTLDPDWIRIGIQPKLLGLDTDQMNTDTKRWIKINIPADANNSEAVLPEHFGASLVGTGDGAYELVALLLWFDPRKVRQLLRVRQVQAGNTT
jgi:hypothetical protein